MSPSDSVLHPPKLHLLRLSAAERTAWGVPLCQLDLSRLAHHFTDIHILDEFDQRS